VLDGDPAAPLLKEAHPQFSVDVCFAQTAGGIKMPPGMDVGFAPGDIVLDGDPAAPPKKVHSPHFSAHVYYGQTDGWVGIPLGTEVGLGHGDIVLAAPLFSPCLLWSNGRPSQQLLSSCFL